MNQIELKKPFQLEYFPPPGNPPSGMTFGQVNFEKSNDYWGVGLFDGAYQVYAQELTTPRPITGYGALIHKFEFAGSLTEGITLGICTWQQLYNMAASGVDPTQWLDYETWSHAVVPTNTPTWIGFDIPDPARYVYNTETLYLVIYSKQPVIQWPSLSAWAWYDSNANLLPGENLRVTPGVLETLPDDTDFCFFTYTLTGAVQLTEAFTCDFNNGSACIFGAENQPYQKSVFPWNERVRAYIEFCNEDVYGGIYTLKWYHNGVLRWQDDYLCDGSYRCWSHCPWWSTLLDPGTGYIEVWFDGRYLGQTNNYTVEPEPSMNLQLLPPPDSVYHTVDPATGLPYVPGTLDAIVANVKVRNAGIITGLFDVKLYENPGPGAIELDHWIQGPLPPDTTVQGIITIPVIPSAPGNYPLGIKVWGKGETEPGWGQLGTAKFNILNK